MCVKPPRWRRPYFAAAAGGEGEPQARTRWTATAAGKQTEVTLLRPHSHCPPRPAPPTRRAPAAGGAAVAAAIAAAASGQTAAAPSSCLCHAHLQRALQLLFLSQRLGGLLRRGGGEKLGVEV